MDALISPAWKHPANTKLNSPAAAGATSSSLNSSHFITLTFSPNKNKQEAFAFGGLNISTSISSASSAGTSTPFLETLNTSRSGQSSRSQ